MKLKEKIIGYSELDIPNLYHLGLTRRDAGMRWGIREPTMVTRNLLV